MAHTQKEKQKLLNRMRRIRGQVEAIHRVLEEDGTCLAILQQATACRGALDGFIAEVVEDHIREHVIDPERRDSPQGHAAEELIEITYQAQLTPWLIAQPDLQYIWTPGGGVQDPNNPSHSLRNELVIGARAVATF